MRIYMRNEKTKKTLEKLCIVQSLVQRSIFTIIAINSCIVDETEAFGQSIFDKYMFIPFFMKSFD